MLGYAGRSRVQNVRKLLFLLGGGVCIALLAYYLTVSVLPGILALLETTDSQGEFLQEIPMPGIRTTIVILAMVMLFAAIPMLPVSVLAVAVGIAYGPILGSLINISGALLGNLLAVTIIRKFDTVDHENQKNRWVASITGMKRPRLGLVLGYMVPIIPSFLMNYTAGLLKIPNQELIPLVLLGVIPTSVLYALGGGAVTDGDLGRLGIVVVAALLLIALAGVFTRRRDTETAIVTAV